MRRGELCHRVYVREVQGLLLIPSSPTFFESKLCAGKAAQALGGAPLFAWYDLLVVRGILDLPPAVHAEIDLVLCGDPRVKRFLNRGKASRPGRMKK